MIIDARAHSHPGYRPMSKIGAVAHVIHQIEVGQHLDVEGLIDAFGEPSGKAYIDTAVSRACGDKRFSVKKSPDKNYVCRIFRVA